MRFIYFVMVVALTACGNSNNTDSVSSSSSPEQSSNGGSSAYEKYLEHPCQLLTEEIVRQHVDNIPGELEKKENVDEAESDEVGGDTRICAYNWEKPEETVKKIEQDFEQVAERLDDQTQSILIEQQQPALLAGSRVVVSDLLQYETPEEAKEAFTKYDEGWKDEKEHEKRRKERLKDRFEDGKLTKAQYERERKKIKGFAMKPVEGVGDMAYWNSNYRAEHLQVLTGTFRFNVEAQVYYDAPEKNKEVAIKIAQSIVEKIRGE